jgi:autophagy-related protein 17
VSDNGRYSSNLTSSSERLHEAQNASIAQLDRQKTAISSLETLGVEMGRLIEQYQVVEVYLLSLRRILLNNSKVEVATLNSTLQSHLVALSGLYETYVNYRASYGNLVQEMDRRRRYRDTVNAIIGGMNEQLKALREGKHSKICVTACFKLYYRRNIPPRAIL